MLVLEKEKLQVMIKVDNLSTDKYEREQKRFSKGIKTTYELLQSKISMLENRSKLLTQQAAYNNSMRDFNFVLANKKDIEYTLETENSFINKDLVLSDMLNSIASNNKLIRKQYINIKINDININLAKANLLPSLTSNISYKYTSDKSTTVNDISTSNKYGGLNIGLNLSLKEYTCTLVI